MTESGIAYIQLLSLIPPTPEETPARVETLAVAAFDVQGEIQSLCDEIASHDELATAQAAEESNDTKRKARKAELLRDNGEYHELKRAVRDLERTKFLLQERASRLRNELRLHIAQKHAEGAFV
jgi:hypothetical protein